MRYSGRAVQQWTDWSRNLAVALQGKSRGDMYAVNMLEEFCKQLSLERPSCRRIWHAAIDVVNAIGEKTDTSGTTGSNEWQGIAWRSGNAHRSFRHRLGSQTQQLFLHKGKEDGKTTFVRDQQRHYERQMLPLGETVMWRDSNGSSCKFASSWVFGVWLLQKSNVGVHVIATR